MNVWTAGSLRILRPAGPVRLSSVHASTWLWFAAIQAWPAQTVLQTLNPRVNLKLDTLSGLCSCRGGPRDSPVRVLRAVEERGPGHPQMACTPGTEIVDVGGHREVRLLRGTQIRVPCVQHVLSHDSCMRVQ